MDTCDIIKQWAFNLVCLGIGMLCLYEGIKAMEPVFK